MLLVSDFGDAPDTGVGTGPGNYNTVSTDNGPSHTIVAGLWMGAAVDADDGTLHNAAANADDVDQALPDDEDGLSNPAEELTQTHGTQPTINVIVTNTTGSAATLSGWIDYDTDGVFDNATERAQAAVANGTSGGIVTLTFPTVPAGFTGQTYARFRLSTDVAAADSTGAAADGEVEDYVARITARGLPVADSRTKIADGLSGGPSLSNLDYFGDAVASLGDLDGDGVTDLAVGSPKDGTGGNFRGAVHVLLMNSDATVKSSHKIAHQTGGGPALNVFASFGESVASLGDLDGDGVSDLAVGATGDYDNRGAVHVLFMNSNGTVKGSQKIAHQTNGGPTLDEGKLFGSSVVSLGDLDGDGVADLVAGAPSGAFAEGDDLRGDVYVLFLNADGTVKSSQKIGHQTNGGPTLNNRDGFGTSAASLGDLDGDGVTDLAIGADRDPNGAIYLGSVHVLFMNSDGTVKNSQKISPQSGGGPTLGDYDRFGKAASSMGDLDGDGVTDLVVGARGGTSQGGDVYVLLMNTNGTVKSSHKIGNQTGGGPPLIGRDAFGASVASLGDLDGDGVTDLAVGATGDDTGGTNRGAVYVLFLGGGNKAPTLNGLTNLTISEDAPQQTVSLAGISAGSGETQPLRVTAASSNTGLIPDPTVTYTTPQTTGTLAFTPVADASGSATVTVTVEDGGPDNDLSTTTDNAKSSRTLAVTVNAVNDAPTLDVLADVTINQGAAEQAVNLTGIATGGGESQPLKITAASDNTGLIPNPTVTYTSPQATGTLQFTPVATASGTATVTVTVEDGGLDNDLSTTADNAKLDRTFGVTVLPAATTVTGLVLNGGRVNRSGLASLTLQFSEATTVDAAGSLILWNNTTGAAVDVSSATLVDNGTNAVTWNLAGIALPDGNYTATLPKTAAGLAATHTRPLHILAGDSSGNAQVDFADFGDLANGFNTAGPIFGPGDMNGDGNVDFTDFGILANNFNNILPALTMDFGDAPESGTSFPTTRANDGARHVLGSGLSLGATVDAEADGQPDANAAGDGADEDGVTFATLTAGSSAAITVPATVPGSAVLNAWIDFNADGDWDDAGEQIISDQAVTNGTNNLTAAIPAAAAAGQVFARFRITTDAGHTYSGLARDGEVEDYQVALVAAKSSSRRIAPAASFNLWAAAFAVESSSPPTTFVGPQSKVGESTWKVVERADPDIVDLAIAEVATTNRRPQEATEDSFRLDDDLVDRVYEQETDPLLPDDGLGNVN